MLGLQPIHIVIIILVALLVFGPRRLPEMGRTIGKTLNELRNGAREVSDSLRAEPSGSQPAGTNFPGTPGPIPPAPAAYEAAPTATIAPPRRGSFCIHCGSANVPEARFCNQCGMKLPENTILPSGDPGLGSQI